MDKVLYISTAGANLAMQAQQVHANNLANVSTPGFRRDFVSSMAVEMKGDGLEARVMPKMRGLGSRFASGAMETTGRAMDVAISGSGWFAVQGSDGNEAYTRAGQLKIDDEGNVLTAGGLAVIGDGGPLQLPDNQSVTFGVDGTVSIVPAEGGNPVQVGQLKLVNPGITEISKGADGLFRSIEGGELEADPQVRLRSGFLEGSNVNALEEMVSFLSLSRQFEAQMKLMKTAGDMASAGDRLVRDQ
ncbi:flagellar basal-body rod protein FlgF [Endozoicomonas sp. 8E]|uniref:flagellar basal-body rod protein FlgF n=1 Tax=Endozoicomonas sp. 8E TaxID=3035692 RepID=UPI00293936C7|nr:flagellar basal-body rod protein FlgF [Endozoicomonas sp. 8E]WOG29071.1 flagellar basal-body rod protein FlgF [Endozoicomonas sp. 8E]